MRGATKNPQAIILNNTGAVIPVKLFTPSPNANASLNATTNYVWDLTPETYVGNQSVTLLVRPKGSSLPFAALTAPLPSQNLAGVVAALNTLNVGAFYSKVVAGRTLIIAPNKYFQLSQLLLGATVIAPFWTSSGSIAVNNLGLTVDLGYSVTDLNTSITLDFQDHFGAAPYVIPISTNTVFLPSQLKDGDTLQLQLFWNPNAVVVNATFLITENGTTIVNSSQSSANSVSVNFTYHLNSVYVITATAN